MLHEYDGAVTVTVVTHRADLDRDRRLLATGWHRRGYTSVDLLHRPDGILRTPTDLGRRHRVDRLDPWLRCCEESLFHRTGRGGSPTGWHRPGSGRSLHRHAGMDRRERPHRTDSAGEGPSAAAAGLRACA